MPLATVPEPFDHPEWLSSRSFRALAYIDGHHCRLVLRRGHVYKSWPHLAEEIAHAVGCRSAVLDGEIVCPQPDGRSQFCNLVFRREWPYYMAFDLLWLDGRDVQYSQWEGRRELFEARRDNAQRRSNKSVTPALALI